VWQVRRGNPYQVSPVGSTPTTSTTERVEGGANHLRP
jgi:hypothetical protein